MDFKKNDIVRLRNEYFDKIKSRIFFPQNIFFIDKLLDDGKSVLLRNVDIIIPSSEICPVKIDGEEDRFIYLYKVLSAYDYVDKMPDILVRNSTQDTLEDMLSTLKEFKQHLRKE